MTEQPEPDAKKLKVDGSNGDSLALGDSLQDLMATLGNARDQFAQALDPRVSQQVQARQPETAPHGDQDQQQSQQREGGRASAATRLEDAPVKLPPVPPGLVRGPGITVDSAAAGQPLPLQSQPLQQPPDQACPGTVLDLTFGVVKKTLAQKGFSLVQIEPLNGQDTVYVHSSVASPNILQERQPVAFKIHVSKSKGQLQASGPLWRLVGEIELGATINWGEFEGRVREDCTVACTIAPKANFTCDPYITPQDMASLKLHSQDVIRFSVAVDEQQRPRVQAPVWKTSGDGHVATGASAQLPPNSAATPSEPSTPATTQASALAMPAKGKGKQLTKQEPLVQVPAEDLTFGYIKSTLPQKGFSLVVTNPEKEDETVYVHRSVANPDILAEGQPVAFKIHLNAKGQPQASKPMWRLVGLVAEGAAVNWGDYTGAVKGPNFLPNGSGFIICPPLKTQYGRDAYVPKEVVEQCGLAPNDVVQFGIQLNSRGEPQVMAPMWKKCSETDGSTDQPQNVPPPGPPGPAGQQLASPQDPSLQWNGQNMPQQWGGPDLSQQQWGDWGGASWNNVLPGGGWNLPPGGVWNGQGW